MKIHSLLLVRNEKDIIKHCLINAVTWSDNIYVFDNGSTDGTWEIINELEKKYEQIKIYKQENCLYHNGLRGEIFNYYKEKSKYGDWWCKLDADEIYVDNPKNILTKISKRYNSVWSSSFQYYFTDNDLEIYKKDKNHYSDEIPLDKRYKYYKNNWSEMRFVKHTRNMKWGENDPWPVKIYPVYTKRIKLKHYQFRSPEQIQKRIENRKEAIQKGTGFLHEQRKDWVNEVVLKNKKGKKIEMPKSWRERIVNASELDYENEKDGLIDREETLAKLRSNIFEAFLAQQKRNIKYIIKKKIH